MNKKDLKILIKDIINMKYKSNKKKNIKIQKQKQQ